MLVYVEKFYKHHKFYSSCTATATLYTMNAKILNNLPLHQELITAWDDFEIAESKHGSMEIRLIQNGESKTSTEILLMSKKRKRIFKKNCCFLCGKTYSKLARHIRTHIYDKEVKNCLRLPPNEQKLKMKEFLQRGNANHNFAALRNGKPEAIIMKKASKRPETSVPCPHCLQFFRSKNLKTHISNCSPASSCGILEARHEKNSYALNVSKDLRPLVNSMKDDTILNNILLDDIIILFGNYLAKRHKGYSHRNSMIRSRLRELGKLRIKLRKVGINSIMEVLKTTNYNALVEATKKIGGFDEENNTFKNPCVAKIIGHSINRCCILAKVRLLKENKDASQIENFQYVMKAEWNGDIQKVAVETMDYRKYNKHVQLPTLEDVKKLANYIVSVQDKAAAKLAKGFNRVAYFRLLEATLVYLIQFNRRRPGEVGRMTLQQYKEGSGLDRKTDMYKSLSETERSNIDEGRYVHIMGKKNWKLGVIIPQNQLGFFKTIIKMRQAAGILRNNKFLFANSKTGNINGVVAMYNFARKCGATNPHLLKATLLRKQLATYAAQLFNIEEGQVHDLAEFQGHTTNVHLRHYRLAGKDLHLRKVAPLLKALESGCVTDQIGKNIYDVTQNVEPQTIKTSCPWL